MKSVHFVQIAIAVACGMVISNSHAAAGVHAQKPSTYTAATAPDIASRQILSSPLRSLAEGTPKGADPRQAIHRNFSRLIDQNLARRDSASTSRWMDQLSDGELRDLAQLYANAAADAGHNARALDVLANRLDGPRLGRLSKHFGWAPVYEAVVRSAPTKIHPFEANSRHSYAAPLPGVQLIGSASPQGIPSLAGAQTAGGPNLDMSLLEIYYTFRTSLVGGYSIGASLFETAFYSFKWLGFAYGMGWWAGNSLFLPLVQTYQPTLYEAIGGTINQIILDYMNQDGAGKGAIEEETAPMFQIGQAATDSMSNFGGDYGVVSEWSDFAGWNWSGCGTEFVCSQP